MLLSLISLAMAEPLMYHISEGEPAPFDGRLFNDEAIAAFISKSEFNVQQCEIANNLDISLRMSEKDLKIEFLEIELANSQDRFDKLISIKDEEITYLSKHVNPKMNNWIFLGGFVAGTTASIFTYYAANKVKDL
jgi:hypothetical protein